MSLSTLNTTPLTDITTYKLVDSSKVKATEWKYFKQYAEVHNRKRYAVCTIC